jgi:hypothetical protein
MRKREPTVSLIQERQSSEYKKIRDELLEAEVVLKDQRERVAETGSPGTSMPSGKGE